MTRIVSSFIALIGASVLACDESRPPTAPLPNPTTLEIGSPTALAPGQSVQLTLTARLSDGSTRDVTAEGRWMTSNSAVASISATGLATGHGPGEIILLATFQGFRASKELIIVPSGTFRVTGTVREAELVSGPVVGAQVTAAAPGGPRVSATTDGAGRFRLYGVAGHVDLSVTKDGYQPYVQPVSVADHMTVDPQLSLLRPRGDLSGSYTLSIAAAEECSARLPSHVRERIYAATIAQNGNQLGVRLAGATFTVVGGMGDRFAGVAEPAQLIFNLNAFSVEDYFYYGLFRGDLMERLDDGSHVAISGQARIPVGDTRLSGRLDGRIDSIVGILRSSSYPVLTSCRSADHAFELRR